MTRRSVIGLAQLPLMAVMGVAEYLWHRYRDSPNGRLDHMTALLALLAVVATGLLVAVPFARSVARPWLAALALVLFGGATGLGAYALYQHDGIDPAHVRFLVVVWAAFFGILMLVDRLAERSQRPRRRAR